MHSFPNNPDTVNQINFERADIVQDELGIMGTIGFDNQRALLSQGTLLPLA